MIIDNEEEKLAARLFIDRVLSRTTLPSNKAFGLKLVAHLQDCIVRYERSLKPNCMYEPIAEWVNVEFDENGKVHAVVPCEGAQPSDDPPVQLCLVYPNSLDPGVTPYAGTWDGTVQDFHNDCPCSWDNYRYGFEPGVVDTDPSKYRFLKTTLNIVMPDGDCEYVPDWFHAGFRHLEDLTRYIDNWVSGNIFSNVPARLVIRKEPGTAPYRGSWDNVEWEEA